MDDAVYSRITSIPITAIFAFAIGTGLAVLGFLNGLPAGGSPLAIIGYGAASGSLLFVAGRSSHRWANNPGFLCIGGLVVAALVVWAAGGDLGHGSSSMSLSIIAVASSELLYGVELYVTEE